MTNTTHTIRSRRSSSAAFVLACVALLQGCRVGPRYVAPVTPAPPAFKEAPQQSADGTTWIPATPQDATLRGNWWELYNEPELNALEIQLNTSNQNIAQSFQNFMAARAQVRQARAQYFPTVTVGPQYLRGRTSSNASGSSISSTTSSGTTGTGATGTGTTGTTGTGTTGTGTTSTTTTAVNLNSNSFSLPFDVSWEPDVWGRVRNTVREYANAAQVSAADLANERLSEQANLAQYYFELRGQDSLIDLYDQTITAYQKYFELTQVRSRTGIDTEQSVAQAELNLKSAVAARTNLRVARAQYEHAIALLTGQAASSFSLAHRALETNVPTIPIGVPSQILQRRPDIAAAERTMAEANALIGVQTAAYYPTFTLGGDLGLQSTKIGNLFTWPSRFFSVGPSASETLIDGGLRKGLLDQYKAQYEADAAAYRQTVLTAFQQTEDYLADIRLLGEQRSEQQDVIVAAQRYFDLANVRYRTGIDTFLNVFTAQTTLLTNQQTAVNLRVQQITSSVQLIEALGGGWDTTQLPTEKAVAHR